MFSVIYIKVHPDACLKVIILLIKVITFIIMITVFLAFISRYFLVLLLSSGSSTPYVSKTSYICSWFKHILLASTKGLGMAKLVFL